MRRRVFLMAAACAAGSPVAQAAPSYPTRVIRLIVPFAPGGATDALARAVAQKLAEMLGQSVIVENRPGAGGNIGTEMVARAPADGYTLLLTINSHVVNPSLYPKLNYDPIKDFQPLTLVATAPNVLVARPGLPARTVPELIALAKSRPGQLTFGSAGTGSGSHLAGVLFDSLAGVKMTHVPYKGVTPAMVDVMGGQVDLCFSVLSVVYPLIKGNKVQAIALTGTRRSPLLPELPTVAETLPGFDVFSWFGLLMPANPLREVFETLQGSLVKIIQAPELKQLFAAQGLELVGNSAGEFAEFLKTDQALWTKVIKANDIRLE
jgi:tripartite-type tricarboxylate transporter receptor subunit TctC